MCKHKLPLKKAIELLGSQTALAEKLEIKQAQVSAWLNRDKTISAKYCVPIEKATNGKVTRYDLRPDVFGDKPER